MSRIVFVGAALIALGLTGYAVGIVAPYPGRAFSVTAIMIGITLVAIRQVHAEVAT